jgi:hypothetical protein
LSRIAIQHGAIVTTAALVTATVSSVSAAAPGDNIIVVRDWYGRVGSIIGSVAGISEHCATTVLRRSSSRRRAVS